MYTFQANIAGGFFKYNLVGQNRDAFRCLFICLSVWVEHSFYPCVFAVAGPTFVNGPIILDVVEALSVAF